MPQQGAVRATRVAIQTVLGAHRDHLPQPRAAALDERERVPVVVVGNAPPNTLLPSGRAQPFYARGQAIPSLVPERQSAMALSWAVQNSGAAMNFAGVWGLGTNNLWSFGLGGAILHKAQ